MKDIFKKRNVWSANNNIAIRKFFKGLIYTAGMAVVTFSINAIISGNIPTEWVVYSGILLAVLQSIKKGLEKYEPSKDR